MPSEPAAPTTDVGTARRPGIVVAAPVLGAMALVSAWTGWGGLALGLLAVVVALAALARLRGSRDTQNEKEQHVCKSQHLDEYRARYPSEIDP